MTTFIKTTFALSAAAIALGQVAADPAPSANLAGRGVAPAGAAGDLITGDISDVLNYGTDGSGNLVYSFGTVACNVGSANVAWEFSTNQHALIGQNMFRVAPLNGHMRIEQLGQAWLKHTYFALSGGVCGTCQPPQGPIGTALGVGCSTPYSASSNADQSNLGPKSDVNAASGFFPFPPTLPEDDGTDSFGRLRVIESEMLPASNPGATWFAEAQHMHPQDSAQVSGLPNGASYRGLTIGPTGQALLSGTTEREEPGISAWGTLDATVTFAQVQVPGENGTFFVGYNAWDNGDGTWDYEVAIQNHNSHRSGGSFSVPVPAGVNVTNIGFRDVDYHSGEPYDDTDWAVTVSSGSIIWSSPQTYAQNPNSNALRWGTMYNFRFTADSAPQEVSGSLGLFRPGDPGSVNVTVLGPGPAGNCSADIDGPGGEGDGNVDSLDFLLLLAQWGTPCMGSCEADITGPAPLVPDGNVDALDFLLLVGQWGSPASCP